MTEARPRISENSGTPRVLALGIDAAVAPLVFRWADEGQLPTLNRLMRTGSTLQLGSHGTAFESAIWHTLITGCLPGKHGSYSWRCHRPGTYEMVFGPGRIYRRQCWEALRRPGASSVGPYRVLLADVPDTVPLGDDGVTELIGWGQRSPVRRQAWPQELYDQVVRRYGRYPRWLNDDMVMRRVWAERRYLRTLLRMLDRRTRLFRDLLAERPWDFALLAYSESHNAGHVFYRYAERGTWAYDQRHAERLGNPLLEVYRGIDRSIGDLLEVAPDGSDVIVFSGAGFRLNANGLTILPQVLTALGYQVPRTGSSGGRLLRAAHAAFPWSLRRLVNARLSMETKERAMQRIWEEVTDWDRSRAVAEPEFGYCWVRFNLRGREPRGVVESGPEYDALCAEIARELEALVDEETGAPAVEEVVRRDSFVQGPNAHLMPDLVVRWPRDRFVRAVRHPRVGVFRETFTDFHWSTHSDDAFVLLSGPSAREGGRSQSGHIVDIAPTLLYLMDAAIPEEMDGEVLADLIAPRVLASRPPRVEPIPWENDPWKDQAPRYGTR